MTRRSDFDRRQAVARLYDEACAAIDKERWQEAVEKLDRVRDNDLDFPGAEHRQRLAHKWHRIAKLHEMGQLHMREARWHDALSCFRQIRRDVDEYKNVALLLRYCERQLIPPPPQDNRKPLLYAGATVAAGVMIAVFGWQFTETLPPGSMAFIPNVFIDVRPPQFPNLLPAFARPSETPGGYTATPVVAQSDATDDPADGSQPDATAVYAPSGPGSIFGPRPTARPRPTRTPTRVIFAATSTRQPATNTPAFAPVSSTATPTIAGSAPTPSPTLTPAATASVDPTPTPLPTSTTPAGILISTETPSPTPADTATTAATIPAATATPIPATPSATATAMPTLPANTATATATLPAPTPTSSATTIPPTPVPPTPTDTATPIAPTPTLTRTPTPVPPTLTRTATPVPAPVTLNITARDFSFAPAGGLVSTGAHVRLTLSNQGTVTHDWVLKDGSGNTLARVNAAPGQLAQLDFVAPAPGVYNFVCDISDYAQQGMKGQLTVR